MSSIAVVSEGDAEEIDAPERADTKGKRTAVENSGSPLLLSIVCVPALHRGL